jgi:hypothetical protein
LLRWFTNKRRRYFRADERQGNKEKHNTQDSKFAALKRQKSKRARGAEQ